MVCLLSGRDPSLASATLGVGYLVAFSLCVAALERLEISTPNIQYIICLSLAFVDFLSFYGLLHNFCSCFLVSICKLHPCFGCFALSSLYLVYPKLIP